jgi:hypothetical protein
MPAKRKFKAYPLGYFHIDIAEVRTEQGKLYLLVARKSAATRRVAFSCSSTKANFEVRSNFHSWENNAPSKRGIKHLGASGET